MSQGRFSALLERLNELTDEVDMNQNRMEASIYTSVSSGVLALSEIDFDLPRPVFAAACLVSVGSATLALAFRENRMAAEDAIEQLHY